MTPPSRASVPGTAAELPPRDTLEREIGRPRADWRSGDLMDFAVRAGVRLVSLMHVGGGGTNWSRDGQDVVFTYGAVSSDIVLVRDFH